MKKAYSSTKWESLPVTQVILLLILLLVIIPNNNNNNNNNSNSRIGPVNVVTAFITNNPISIPVVTKKFKTGQHSNPARITSLSKGGNIFRLNNQPLSSRTTMTATTNNNDNHNENQQELDDSSSNTISESESSSESDTNTKEEEEDRSNNNNKKKRVVIIGAGWGGLSVAHTLSSNSDYDITVVDASSRVGGLVRDGFQTMNGSKRKAEAGQHGFWNNYHNIYKLLDKDLPNVNIDDVLTDYAEQGQYSPNGLEAIWPIYRNMNPTLPTGLAQALYTKFTNLPVLDRISAAPLVLAFSEFDDSIDAWEKYDNISFRDLCIKLGVSRRCYDEAFEPMILTGLFAPGAECSAAAALGMAYFFVLKSQNSFDVRWCRGNIGEKIFQPWVDHMMNKKNNNVKFMTSTRVEGFETTVNQSCEIISKVLCRTATTTAEKKNDEAVVVKKLDADVVVFAVGGAALNGIVRNNPSILGKYSEFRRYANLRGTGVLATRLYLDRHINIPYSANACWGFDRGVGMTFFDISTLHSSDSSNEDVASSDDTPGSVIEVDYYHAASLLVMDDQTIVDKVKKDLDTILGEKCVAATVVDAAIVRLPQAVNWYSPGSYANMPDAQSKAIPNVYFAGDLVRSRHGSWSQEKAYVSGIESANLILGNNIKEGVIPLSPDEPHVAAGRTAVSVAKSILGGSNDPSKGPSLVDFLF